MENKVKVKLCICALIFFIIASSVVFMNISTIALLAYLLGLFMSFIILLSWGYIARIQWLGNGEKKEQPFYGWKHWTEASSHTHFIIIIKKMFFCNEENRWWSLPRLHKYLAEGEGILTSYLEVSK